MPAPNGLQILRGLFETTILRRGRLGGVARTPCSPGLDVGVRLKTT
jgi:hypothetical protein